MVGKVVSKTGATVRARGILYKSVLQSVLLYGSESWVVTGDMLKVIECFHHQVARRMTGATAQHMAGGEWEWPLVAETMETSGLWKIKGYIKRRKDTVVAQVACM